VVLGSFSDDPGGGLAGVHIALMLFEFSVYDLVGTDEFCSAIGAYPTWGSIVNNGQPSKCASCHAFDFPTGKPASPALWIFGSGAV
jgi:hypothetical protein